MSLAKCGFAGEKDNAASLSSSPRRAQSRRLCSRECFRLSFAIPVVGRFVIPYVRTRLIVAFGMIFLGLAFLYATNPDAADRLLDAGQNPIGADGRLGLSVCAISTAAYLTLPHEQSADAAALYPTLRNLPGSIGVSVSTALITTHSQIRQAYLTNYLTPLNSFNSTIARIEQSFTTMALSPSQMAQSALSISTDLVKSGIGNSTARCVPSQQRPSLFCLLGFRPGIRPLDRLPQAAGRTGCSCRRGSATAWCAALADARAGLTTSCAVACEHAGPAGHNHSAVWQRIY